MARRRRPQTAAPRTDAVIYIRVSTQKQVDGSSLGTQREACERHCTAKGWKVQRIFREPGVSAKTAQRPELAQLLAYCKHHQRELAAVVVYDFSRFSRNNEDFYYLRGQLRSMGIRFDAVAQQVSDGPEGALMESIYAGFAQFDNDLRKQKIELGMRATLKNGGWPFKPSLGYRKTRVAGKGATLEPHAFEAPILRRCFQMIDEGRSLQEAARYAEQAGLVGRETRRPLTGKDLGQLLRRDIYCGLVEVEGWGKYGIGEFEPVVSSDVWRRVQDRLDRKFIPPPAGESAYTFPLRRFARCVCDQPLTASASKNRFGTRYPYYHCHKCGLTRVRKSDLESMFVRLLNDHALDGAALELVLAEVMRQADKRATLQAVQDRAMREQLTALREKKDRLLDLLVEKVISQNDYLSKAATMEGRIAEIEQQLETRQQDVVTRLGELLALSKAVLLDPGGFWSTVDQTQKARFQNAAFPAGSDGNIRTPASDTGLSSLRSFVQAQDGKVGPPGFEPGSDRL